jgi:SAM-dependent methyltransferase
MVSGDDAIKYGERYSRRALKEHFNRYVFALAYVQGKRVLDIACGAEYGSYFLTGGARRVVGGDIARQSVLSASRAFAARDVDYCCTDATRLPFADSAFDVIVSMETIEHLEKPDLFLEECVRCLRPGGIFICSTPNKAVTSPNSPKPLWPYHVREYYEEEFVALLREHFTEVSLFAQGVETGSVPRRRGLLRSARGFRMINRLGIALRPLLNRSPAVRSLVNLSAGLVGKDFQLTSITRENLADFVDASYGVVPMEPGMVPAALVAVAIAPE